VSDDKLDFLEASKVSLQIKSIMHYRTEAEKRIGDPVLCGAIKALALSEETIALRRT
jgi:hypothetical protein